MRHFQPPWYRRPQSPHRSWNTVTLGFLRLRLNRVCVYEQKYMYACKQGNTSNDPPLLSTKGIFHVGAAPPSLCMRFLSVLTKGLAKLRIDRLASRITTTHCQQLSTRAEKADRSIFVNSGGTIASGKWRSALSK